MADETVPNVRRVGDAQQALTKLSAPPQVQQLDLQPTPPAAAGTATAAAAPGTGANAAPAPAQAAPRALPPPTITVNSTAAPGVAPGVATPPPAAAAPAATIQPAAAQPLPPYRVPNPAPGGPNFVQTPAPVNPSFRPAAAGAAAGKVPVGSASLLKRAYDAGGTYLSNSPRAATALGALGKTVGRVGRGAGYLGAAAEGYNAIEQAHAGHTGAALESGGFAGLDAIAAAAPTPITIGAALTAHAVNAAANTDVAQRGFARVAEALPGGGPEAIDAMIADMQASAADRLARGLPLPAQTDNRITTAQNIRNEQFGGPIFIDPANPSSRDFQPPSPAGAAPSGPRANFSNVQHGVEVADPSAVPSVPRGSGAADPSTWTPSARAALSSTTPGTAVINGRTYTKDQIDALANRNVISSDAFRNPAPGVAYSEATGGGTLELGQGPTSRSGGGGFTAADRQRQLEAIENGPDSRSPEALAAKARESTRNSLISDARNALRSGKRKTAGRLIELLTAANGADTADARIAEANRPQRGQAGRTDAQEALTAAQMEEAQANTATARQKLATEIRMGHLQDALVSAKTPEEQQATGRALALLSGRELPQKKIGYIDVPIPGDPLGQKQRLPYDPETNQVLMPKGLTAVYTDAQGNQQRRPALQQ